MTRPLLTLTGLILCNTVWADINNIVHFSGFGTVGASFNHDDDADYTAAFEQASGVGRTRHKDQGLDSVFALQTNINATPAMTLTAQLQSRRLADDRATSYFEWANIKYAVSQDLSLRIGRVVAPMFMVSESRAIGYSQTTARLPGEVYLLNPIAYVDGGGVTQQFVIGNVWIAANATTGKLEQEVPSLFGDITVDYDADMLNVTLEYGDHQWRLGAARAELTFYNADFDLLSAALDVLTAANVAGAQQLATLGVYEDFDVDFFDVGYQYDNSQWILQAEWVSRRADSYIVTDNDAFYVLGGIRFQTLTPYVRYSRSNSLNDGSLVPIVDASATDNDVLMAIASSVNDFGKGLKAFDERESRTLGLRWDFADNLACKLQYDHVLKPAGNAGLFLNFTDAFRDRPQRLDIFSMTLDFVF